MIDYIHTIREIMNRLKEYDLLVVKRFIGFEKAIDSIYLQVVLEDLRNREIGNPYLEILTNKPKAVERHEKILEFHTERGGLQGDRNSEN